MKNSSIRVRLGYALDGWRAAFAEERSLRTHVLFIIAAIIALLILRPKLVWWALFAIISVVVISAELFNTALERLSDHLHPDIHPAIKAVKDIAAAAVLVTSIGALLVAGLMVLAVVLGG